MKLPLATGAAGWASGTRGSSPGSWSAVSTPRRPPARAGSSTPSRPWPVCPEPSGPPTRDRRPWSWSSPRTARRAGGYPFRLRPEGEGWVVETRGIIRGVVEDLLAGRATGEISSTFHRTMAEVVVTGCEEIREAGGVAAVALSGGTFQNMLLLEQVVGLLEEKGFEVYRHRRVPANDGGLALGQAILADRGFATGLKS